MTTKRLWRTVLAAVVLGAAAVACSPTAIRAPTPEICDGISSEAGGCDPGRHAFTSTTCEELAREWAAQLDKAVVAVIDGPEVLDDEARSVRLRQGLVVLTVDVNERLRELGLRADCDLPAFMAAAEPGFSPHLRATVGDALFDGEPKSTYEDWLADVERVVRVIDDEE